MSQFSNYRSGIDTNGLAIGANGTPIFAYDRRPGAGRLSQVRILEYVGSPVTAQPRPKWYETGITNSNIAGAIDPASGNYYFGGYTQGSNQLDFKVFRYDVNTSRIEQVGLVKIRDQNAGGLSNGDMAFDVHGNLYLLHATQPYNGQTRVRFVTVPRAELGNPDGRYLKTSETAVRTFHTSAPLNGMAVDQDGTVFVSNRVTAYRVDPTNWQTIEVFSGSIGGSRDLASCVSPPRLNW